MAHAMAEQGSGEIAEVCERAELPRQLSNGVRRDGTDGEHPDR